MSQQDRRSFLRGSAAIATLGVTGALAGCSTNRIPVVGSSSSVPSTVPKDSDSVVYADIDTILADDGVRTLTNTYLAQQSQYEYYDGPESIDEWISEIEDEWETDLESIDQATAFGEFGGEDYETYDPEYGAAIVNADFTVEDARSSFEEVSDQDMEDDEYNGQVVFETEDGDLWIGTLGSEGSIVIGTEDGVKDAIDVSQGDEDTLEDELSNAFSNTRESPFRFASYVPDTGEDEPIPEETTRYDSREDEENETYDLTVFDDVEVVSGAVYVNGETRGMEVSLIADSSDTATELAELLQEMQDDWVSMWEDHDEDVAQDIASTLSDVDISQTGSTVTSSLEKEISELDSLIAEYAGPREE